MAKAKTKAGAPLKIDLEGKKGYRNFGEALEEMASGLTLTRKAWAVKDTEDRVLELLQPIPGQVLDTTYIVDWGTDSRRRPWAPTHEDLLATDWLVSGAATVI